MKAWLVCQGTGPGKDISTTKLKSSWALDGLLLSNDNGLSIDTVSLILFLLNFLQVCAQKAIFAEGHCVSTSEWQFFYFQLVGYLFVLYFYLTRLVLFSRFTFIRSEMTPARAIQQSPSSFLEDSSTSSVHSSSQSLEVEAEREQRRSNNILSFDLKHFWPSVYRTF